MSEMCGRLHRCPICDTEFDCNSYTWACDAEELCPQCSQSVADGMYEWEQAQSPVRLNLYEED